MREATPVLNVFFDMFPRIQRKKMDFSGGSTRFISRNKKIKNKKVKNKIKIK